MSWLICRVSVLLAGLGGGWAAQEAAPQALVLRGRVIEAGSRTPLRGAVVTIRELGAMAVSRTVETDEQGAFTAAGLAPGNYSLVGLKPGYRKAQGAFRNVKLEQGKDSPLVELALQMGGAIAGRVLDEMKQGVPKVTVGAWRRRYGNGRVSFQPMESAMTDAKGYFQIAGLAPGVYHVGTREPRRAVATSRTAEDRPSVQAAFHPNSDDLAQAAAVVMGDAEKKDGIDIFVRRGPRFCVEGKATGHASGETVSISVYRRWDHAEPSLPDVVAHGMVPPGVPFFACGLARGWYEIWASQGNGPGAEGAFTRTQAWITKSNADVGELRFQPLAPVKIEVTQKKEERVPVRGVVILEPVDRLPWVAEKTQFDLARPSGELRVYPDRFRLVVRGLPPDAYLEAAEYDSLPAKDTEFAVSGGTLRLRFARDAARLTGMVKKAGGGAGGPGFVLLAPDRPQSTSAGVRTAPVDEGGAYRIDGIEPGVYRALAVGGGAQPEFTDPAALQRALAGVEKLDLAPKRVLVLDLTEQTVR